MLLQHIIFPDSIILNKSNTLGDLMYQLEAQVMGKPTSDVCIVGGSRLLQIELQSDDLKR